MGYNQVVPNVGTSDGPSWTIQGNQIWMAWKGQGTDSAIYVASTTTVQADPSPATGTYAFSGQNNSVQYKIPGILTSAAPSIVSSGGTLFLFFKGHSDDVINSATCSDGKTWVNQGQLVVNQSLSQTAPKEVAKTSASPTAISSNGTIVLVYKGASTNHIWCATLKSGYWSQFQVVAVASGDQPLTDDSPAAAIVGNMFHLVWKGASGEGFYWMTQQFVDVPGPDPTAEAQRIFSLNGSQVLGPPSSPVLVVDGSGTLWLVWVSSPYVDFNISWKIAAGNDYRSTPQICFASLGSNNKWSIASTRLGIVPGARPSLISAGPDATYLMIAWKNQGTDWSLNYGPLRLPARSYVFALDSVSCITTRSGGWYANPADTDYASISVQVSGVEGVTSGSMAFADVENNQGAIPLASDGGNPQNSAITLPAISVPDNAQVVMNYYVLNSSSPQDVALAVVEQTTEGLVKTAVTAAIEATGAALGALIGAEIGTEAVPVIGSALGAVVGYCVGAIWGIAFPHCDGPVANAVRAFTAAELSTASGILVQDEQPSPGMQPPMVTQDGCGNNPSYLVFWKITPA